MSSPNDDSQKEKLIPRDGPSKNKPPPTSVLTQSPCDEPHCVAVRDHLVAKIDEMGERMDRQSGGQPRQRRCSNCGVQEQLITQCIECICRA